MNDLQFNLHARDATAAAFDSARRRARDFNGELDRGGRGFDTGAARARNYSTVVRSAGHETANLAAQLNDIGVSLAGGQSPFQVAIQQGSQINQVLGQRGVAGAVSMLGGAFVSLINPVSLATIALIAGGAYAAQYFAEVVSGSDKSAEALKQEAQLIQDVASKWGDVLPALKAYADERQRLTEEKDIGAATKSAVDELLVKFREVVPQVEEEIFRLNTALLQTADPGPVIAELEQAFSNLEAKVADGTAQADDLMRMQDALASAFVSTGIPAAQAMADILAGLAAQYGATADQAARLNAEEGAALARGGVPVSKVQGGRGGDPRSFVDDKYWQNRRFPDPAEMEKPRRAAAGGAAKEQADSYQVVIDRLREEQEMMGLNATEQRILMEQRRAGVDAASAQGQEIDRLVRKMEEERAAAKDLAQEQAALNKSMDYLQDAAFEGMWALASNAKNAEEQIKQLGMQILKAAAYALLFNKGPLAGLLGGIFGGGGGGFFGRILGAASPAPALASGWTAARGVGSGLMANAQQAGMGGGVLTLELVSNFRNDGGFETAVSRVAGPIAVRESTKMGRQAAQAGASMAVKQVRGAMPAMLADTQARTL